MTAITSRLLAVALDAIVLSAAIHQPAGATPVAIVARVQGEATVESAPGAARLRLFDRLAAGDTLRTSAGAEVVVAFRSGARLRVGAGSRVQLGDGVATKIAGTVETLVALSPLPLVAPAVGAGTVTAAVRIRSQPLAIHAPPIDTVTRADATVLAFGPASTDGYDIEIEDASAAVVFRLRARETTVTVPPTALAPGSAYRWRVTARQPSGFAVVGEGRFRTLSLEDARARARLFDATAAGDGELRGLLAETDWMLGLWREALEGFRAARAAGLTDPIVAERIADLERRGGPPPARPEPR